MNEEYMAQHIQEIMEEITFKFDESESGITRIIDFEEAGIITRDQGFVIKMIDGSEFQITVVKSK